MCEIVGFWVVYVDFVLVGWYWLECWLDWILFFVVDDDCIDEIVGVGGRCWGLCYDWKLLGGWRRWSGGFGCFCLIDGWLVCFFIVVVCGCLGILGRWCCDGMCWGILCSGVLCCVLWNVWVFVICLVCVLWFVVFFCVVVLFWRLCGCVLVGCWGWFICVVVCCVLLVWFLVLVWVMVCWSCCFFLCDRCFWGFVDGMCWLMCCVLFVLYRWLVGVLCFGLGIWWVLWICCVWCFLCGLCSWWSCVWCWWVLCDVRLVCWVVCFVCGVWMFGVYVVWCVVVGLDNCWGMGLLLLLLVGWVFLLWLLICFVKFWDSVI